MSTLGGALQGATVEDDRARVAGSGFLQAGEDPQVMRGILEAPGHEPAVRLLAHRLRGRKVVREVPPLCSRACHPEQGVQHVPNRVFPLRGVLGAEQQIG